MIFVFIIYLVALPAGMVLSLYLDRSKVARLGGAVPPTQAPHSLS